MKEMNSAELRLDRYFRLVLRNERITTFQIAKEVGVKSDSLGKNTLDKQIPDIPCSASDLYAAHYTRFSYSCNISSYLAKKNSRYEVYENCIK